MKVASVWVRRGEGRFKTTEEKRDHAGRFFASLTEANRHLSRMARTVASGSDKCDFVITYEDGEQYTGRFDLQRHHALVSNLIEDHVTFFLMFYAGLRCPTRLTQEQYESFLALRERTDPKMREECVKWLANYQLFAT